MRSARPQQALAAQGKKVSHAHLRWLSPLEPGLAKIIKNFKHVIVAELNMGQLRTVLRAEFLIDAVGLNKIQGQPFKVREVIDGDRQAARGRRRIASRLPATQRHRRTHERCSQDQALEEGPRVRPGRPLVPGLR